jgi:hypothetical protein
MGVICMSVCPKLFLGAAFLALAAGTASAQTKPAGDKDDQFVITGCVTLVNPLGPCTTR